MSPRIDFVCDTYQSPSIKDIERENRGTDESAYVITGPEQKRPKEWQHALQSGAFKTSFFQFLAIEWQKDAYAEILKDHQVFLGYDTECIVFENRNGHVICTAFPALFCQHEEADTRIILYLANIIASTPEAMSVLYVMILMCSFYCCTMSPIWIPMQMSGWKQDSLATALIASATFCRLLANRNLKNRCIAWHTCFHKV